MASRASLFWTFQLQQNTANVTTAKEATARTFCRCGLSLAFVLISRHISCCDWPPWPGVTMISKSRPSPQIGHTCPRHQTHHRTSLSCKEQKWETFSAASPFLMCCRHTSCCAPAATWRLSPAILNVYYRVSSQRRYQHSGMGKPQICELLLFKGYCQTTCEGRSS